MPVAADARSCMPPLLARGIDGLHAVGSCGASVVADIEAGEAGATGIEGGMASDVEEVLGQYFLDNRSYAVGWALSG